MASIIAFNMIRSYEGFSLKLSEGFGILAAKHNASSQSKVFERTYLPEIRFMYQHQGFAFLCGAAHFAQA
eukprot:2535566-Pleurochrysis_carterae.AAC.1